MPELTIVTSHKPDCWHNESNHADIDKQVMKSSKHKMLTKKMEEHKASMKALDKDKQFLSEAEMVVARKNIENQSAEMKKLQEEVNEFKNKLWRKQFSKETKVLLRTPKDFSGEIDKMKNKKK